MSCLLKNEPASLHYLLSLTPTPLLTEVFGIWPLIRQSRLRLPNSDCPRHFDGKGVGGGGAGKPSLKRAFWTDNGAPETGRAYHGQGELRLTS
jgi:hypothetical protein